MSTNYSKKTTSLVDAGLRAPSLVSSQAPADTLTYEPYFGLEEKPFSLNADPRFVYDSPAYASTRNHLLAGIKRREGLLVLTGEIGTGKTTLCRSVLRELGRKSHSSIVPDPFASREDLLKMLLIDFGAVSIQELAEGRLRQSSRTELGYLLAEFLNGLPADAYAVVILDEAQNLTLPLIEETRILSDTFGARGRLQIVFVGQPELHAKLKLPEMRQVDQRVCGYHRLAPMSRDVVAGYIQHRLQAAGANPDRVLFPSPVVDVLHRRTGGVPRLINRVCDRALHLAHERRAATVTADILDAALIELGAATMSPTWDSIVFAQPSPSPAVATTPVAAPAPAPVPAAQPVSALPAAEDEEDFEKQIDNWVGKDLGAASRPPASSLVKTDAAPRRRPAPPAPRRDVPTRHVKTDWPRDLRSETYMQRLWRVWFKRAAIAAGAFVAVNVMLVAVSVLTNFEGRPAAATPEVLPATASAGIAPLVEPVPDARPFDAPAITAPATEPSPAAGAAVEYLVSVGLFSSREGADALVDTLTQAGLAAMQRPFRLGARDVQQVVIGPFFSRAEAAADLRRLQALGGYADARVIEE